MRWTHVLAVGAVASIGLTAACAAPSSDSSSSGGKASDGKVSTAAAGLDANAKGPAPTAKDAKKGGRLTILSGGSGPADMDPSAQFYQDSGAMMSRLLYRSLTAFVQRDGQQVLVPDLAEDLGKASEDGLTWTFKIKKGIKYHDGTEIKPADIAYAVKRSFAFTDTGPTYQVDFLKGGADYKGPWQSGDTFAGVEATEDSVIFHLEKRWETLPYFAAFSQTAPIPAAKDTKDKEYGKVALFSGPYKMTAFNQGNTMTLEKNTYWDANTDPARNQNVDGYDFKFKQNSTVLQQQILSSQGADARALTYDSVEAEFADQVKGDKKDQFVKGPSSCTLTENLDTRRIPMEVRKAIAAAYPFDDIRKAAAQTDLTYIPASTLIPPQIPGHLDYVVFDMKGQGKGDPEKAKSILKAAGKEGFELKYYFVEDDPAGIAQKVNEVRKKAYEAAGFKVTAMGVPSKDLRNLRKDVNGPHNMRQSPAGWCFDWPSADSIFPPTVSSTQIKANGSNWGNLADPEVDKRMDDILKLPIAEQGKKWGEFDKWLMENYLPAIPVEYDTANILFGTKVKNVLNDPNHGMPIFDALWVEN